MTDDIPWISPDDDPSRPARAPRRCIHRWERVIVGPSLEDAQRTTRCSRCGRVRDEAAYARGRSARRLGGDMERRIERVYGPTKIGERGDPVDHIGGVWRWQSKATRADPPVWLAAVAVPTYRQTLPAALRAAFDGMAGLYDPRTSVVVRSYVRPGVRTRDWLIIRPSAARAWFALYTWREDVTPDSGWWVIPGDWWLDHYGRDTR